MSNDANKLTPAQSLTVLRQVVLHKDLRFLNVEEAHVVASALAILDNAINPKPEAPAAELTVLDKPRTV